MSAKQKAGVRQRGKLIRRKKEQEDPLRAMISEIVAKLIKERMQQED